MAGAAQVAGVRDLRTQPALEAALWLLLLAGLSPVLVDWGRHLLGEPAARYAVIFVPLTLLLALREGGGERAGRAAALWWLSGAVLLALLAVGAGLTRFARPCLALAVLGMALWRGRPRPRVALLSFWCVPVPSFVLKSLERALAGSWPEEVGMPFFALFSGLAYAYSLWRGGSLVASLRRAALAGLAGLGLQLGVLALGCGTAAALRLH